MACTNQSAEEYIRNARVWLEHELKNLSVIVDNLLHMKVFSQEEVSKIESEKVDYDKARRLLDWVTNKGERACYEFLKIIYVTRKRISERPVNNVASTETKKFDLDYWISCFSFTADPLMDTSCYYKGPKLCHKYQEKLKEEAQKLSAAFWKSNQKLFAGRKKPHLSYASLVLDTQGRVSLSKIKKLKSKKMKMRRPKKMKLYFPVEQASTGKTVSLDDLLNTWKNVLVVGKSGIGKTALAHQLLKLWSERDNDKLDYMFYFDSRRTDRMKDLEDLLFNLFCEPAEGKEEVLQDLKKNSDSVTVIIDGVTDPSSSVVWSIVDKCLPDAKVIVTCRVEDEEDFAEDFFRVEVKGFSEQTIKTYFHAALGKDQEKVVNNVELLTLCHVPVYALMVAVCFSSESSADCQELCTLTDIYINIVRFCLQRNNNIRTKDLNEFISTKREELLSLAEAAFNATEAKTVSLTELPVLHEDHCILSFLRVAESRTMFAFLHYSMQEFFAALWLLKNPDKLVDVVQQSLTEEMKHMQHVIPFTCRLLSEKNPTLMKWLLPAEQLQETSDRFFTQMMSCFYNVEDGLQVDLLFLCQCLFESQRPEECVSFLDQLDYDLDLSGEKLDPSSCCAVAYVISQSKERKVRLNLEKTEVSEQGASRLFGCLQHVQWSERLAQQLWKILLLSPGQVDHRSLLCFDGHQLRLPVVGEVQLFERAVKVLQESTRPVQVCLYRETATAPCPGLNKSLLEALPWISSLSFRIQDQDQDYQRLEKEKQELLLALCLTAALHNEGNFDRDVKKLFSMFSLKKHFTDFLFDFYQRLKSEGHLSIIPKLRSFFQSTPSVWIIDLSEGKSLLQLEVLQLQSQKKQVKLISCSVEESEVKSFLQCLPHISRLSFSFWYEDPDSVQLCVNVFRAAAAEGEETLELLASVCRYETFPLHSGTNYGDKYQSDFLLDLYCGLKDCESERGLSVLPSLRSVLQSAPSVWTINLSERKISILLEVLQLQSQKKQVELISCSVEESEVKSFLQCLPHISQLSFRSTDPDSVQLCVNVFRAAAAEGEETLELLTSVCRYKTFPLYSGTDYDGDEDKYQSDFLLDLYCGLKDCESERGLSVLPSLRSVLQSTPSVWTIDLSERKISILLEVLQLQSEKKQVELRGCSVEESEVKSFLQCLPHISQLSFRIQDQEQDEPRLEKEKQELLLALCLTAALHNEGNFDHVGKKLFSMFSLTTDFTDFLFDFYQRLKSEGHLSIIPTLRSFFQSTPSVWTIDLSQRQSLIKLEVLQLQSEKKQVKLISCSVEESEVKSFLQCLPHISRLSFRSKDPDSVQLCVNVFRAAAAEGEETLELLASVCRYETFPLHSGTYYGDKYQCNFLLDLYCGLKDCESERGLSVLPSLRSVLKLTTSVWTIDLSQRKISILLEVLQLQSQKKQVELISCSVEESEVKSFLQCLPHISQLSFWDEEDPDSVQFCVNMFRAAAAEGEETLELLASVCRYETFPLNSGTDYDDEDKYQCDFLLDLYCGLKDCESERGLSVLPSLRSVLQSTPSVWTIDLSERKISILLEVLQLQSEKKQVELRGCSVEESEVKSFLQCLPHISQLSFRFWVYPWSTDPVPVQLCVNVFRAAAAEGEETLELLTSVCRYETFPLHSERFDDDNHQDYWDEYQRDFFLDLYCGLKDCESERGLSVLPSLRSVLQSTPSVWTIDLSERKISILLEVLQLQSEKKQVELRGCSVEESEVKSFLQCLPHISQLSFRFWVYPWSTDPVPVQLCVNVFRAAAAEGEETLELLTSVCRYETFPLHSERFDDDNHQDYWDEYQRDFFLDLYCGLKDCESERGLSVLPSLRSVLQSTPSVWTIDLSERKISILLEVLQLQSEKKQVELRGCSVEESEVKSFLQCLPHISQLSFWDEEDPDSVQLCVNVFRAAAAEGEETLELLASVCRYETFPLYSGTYYDDKYQCDFLLDLYCGLKDCESERGLSVLPSLRSVLQSTPSVWTIDLSERKSSILLEVLQLQSEKKQVKLISCSVEESEVKSFLQCLPHISQLSFWDEDPVSVQLCVNVFRAAAAEGEETLELLASVCRYETFPLHSGAYYGDKYRSNFLLDLYCGLKDCESERGLSVLPSLRSVLQSAPSVWTIDLSQRKTSILLEVLQLQSEKKQVKLISCSVEESEVKSFLQCLPHISQLRFWSTDPDSVQLCVNVFRAAAAEGEETLELLTSVCRYETFPLHSRTNYGDKYQSDFLLDLYCGLKDCESERGLSVLPSLRSVLQSTPSVWTIDLSERKISILLEVLQLQSEKKQVKLISCSVEESEVKSFLQCLPHISQLRCDPQLFQTMCTSITVRSEEAKQLGSLLRYLDSTVQLTGRLLSKTCRSVGRALGHGGSGVDLILQPSRLSARGASLLFKHVTEVNSLRLPADLALLLCRWVTRGTVSCELTVQKLSLAPAARLSDSRWLKGVSGLASLLRIWTIQDLDLTELCVPAQTLIPLLLHEGRLTIKLSQEVFQELLFLLPEIQDKVLTRSFLSKVGTDLSFCRLNWELLHYLLQQSAGLTITVKLGNNRFLQEKVTHLLPFLDRVVIKRPCPSFVLTVIREVYAARAGHVGPGLLRSFSHEINLSCRQMSSADCDALLYTLQHSDGVKLKLLWSSIPTWSIESILFMLDKVSQLSLDRNLLLRFVHCCAASDSQQGAAVNLLRTLNHSLDLSCSSSVDLDQQDQSQSLSLTGADCRAISNILRHSSCDTWLDLRDCEMEDSGLDQLFPVLDRVLLRTSKDVLLRLVFLLPVNTECLTVRRAVSLCKSLQSQLDLSSTTLDQRTCGALAVMLDLCEGLTDLDLSHCGLEDQLLLPLFPHLHKVDVLDLSHNRITDASTAQLQQLVSLNPSMDTVRLFGNNIVDREPFHKDKRFEMW